MYLSVPYPRLYEHCRSECALIVEREYQGEMVVLTGKMINIEDKSLSEIDLTIKFFRNAEVWSVSEFRQMLRMRAIPSGCAAFRHVAGAQLVGPRRARRAGTFSMSSLGGFGVEQIHPLSPLTTYFTFGPIQRDGRVTLKIIHDHRVIDGRYIAQSLVDLEHVLNTALLKGLKWANRFAA